MFWNAQGKDKKSAYFNNLEKSFLVCDLFFDPWDILKPSLTEGKDIGEGIFLDKITLTTFLEIKRALEIRKYMFWETDLRVLSIASQCSLLP